MRAYMLIRRCRWAAVLLLVVAASYFTFWVWIARAYAPSVNAGRLSAIANSADAIRARRAGFCPSLADIRSEADRSPGGILPTLDAYGHAFLVHCEGPRIEIRCVGADGLAGTSDDQLVTVE